MYTVLELIEARGFARQPCCMAGTMKIFCIRKHFSCNMVQNLDSHGNLMHQLRDTVPLDFFDFEKKKLMYIYLIKKKN